jgi:4-amino-4-deoxy-L-arabinose transferase-like glycosyltransferase
VWSRKRLIGPGLLLVGALALRLVLWNRAVGFEQGDPLEYVNIAYKLAFGIGIEWWDLRPLLLPILYVPVLYLAQLWPDASGEAMVRALRLVSVLFGTGIVGLTYLLGRRLTGEMVGLGAGLLVAVNPVVSRLSVSTYAELPSTFFLLWCLWLLVRACSSLPAAERGAGGVRSFLWLAGGAGLALGLGCMIRYQAIFYLPPIGLWVAMMALVSADGGLLDRVRATLDPRSRAGGLLLGFGGGLLLAILLQGTIELLAYGRPFHSLLVSFDYNVTSGLAPVEFGQEPFGWFVWTAPDWLGLPAAVLVLLGLPGLVRGPSPAGWRLVGLAGLTMFLALSALPHKEDRFMAQVLPLLALLAAQGAAATVSRGLLAALLIAVAAVPMLLASWALDLQSNVGYVAGVKRAAELRPGGTLGTIPWLVARPYAGTTLTLERMDRNVWERRDEVAHTIEVSDFLLFPEYWLLEDREVDKLVSARFHSVESYEDGVVLYQNRRLDEPSRRRGR